MIRLLTACATLIALALPARAEIEIQEVTSPGGIEAWLVEDHNIPFVALEIRFRGGASLDRPGKRGAINLMTAILEEGAGDMDAQGFAQALEEIAASIDYRSYDDSLSVSARYLTETQDRAAELLRLSLTDPRFDEDAVERVRQQVLSGIASDAKDPSEIASTTLNSMAFGDHPYGSSEDGTLDTVAALTRQDMFDALADTVARDRLYVSAAGDITAEQLASLLDTLFADLPETGAPIPPAADWLTEGGTTVIDFDTPQSVALFAQPGMDRLDPDFFAAYIVNTILGEGGFEARLMNEVREKRGLTYGVGSYLVPKDLAALVIGQMSSSNDRVAEAIEVVKAEWARIAETGVTAEELEDAKTYLTGSYPLRFDGNGPIANILVGMQMTGLEPDYIVTRNDKIDAVTLEEANRVASELYRPDELRFVVVGRPEGLTASE